MFRRKLSWWGDAAESRLGRAHAVFDRSTVESLNSINAELAVCNDPRATAVEKSIAVGVAFGHSFIKKPIAFWAGVDCFFRVGNRR